MLTSKQTGCFGRTLGESLSVFNQVTAFHEPQYLFPYVLASAMTLTDIGSLGTSWFTHVLQFIYNGLFNGFNQFFRLTNREGIIVM
jgi:hypothetical protein